MDGSHAKGAARQSDAPEMAAPEEPLIYADPGPESIPECCWRHGFRPLYLHGWKNPARDPDTGKSYGAGKKPEGFGWAERARRNPPDATRRPPRIGYDNIGILADELRAIDIDIDGPFAAEIYAAACQILGGEPLVRFRENSTRLLLVYAAALGEPRKRWIKGEAGKVEILGWGQQFAAFGKHETYAPLCWRDDRSPATVQRAELPMVMEQQITHFLETCALFLGAEPIGDGAEHDPSEPVADLADVEAALQVIPPTSEWNAWNRVAMATWAATEGQGFDLFNAWSARDASYDATGAAARWQAISGSPPDRIGAGTLFFLAREAVPGWTKPSAPAADGTEFGPVPPETDPFNPGNQPMTQDGAALAFVAAHADTLRYCHGTGAWFQWNGAIWKRETTKIAFDWARSISRAMALRGDVTPSMKRAFGSAMHATAVERFAQADRRMAVTIETWDRDPFMLGTPGGTVDLRTGELLPAGPAWHITQCAAVTPSETADCPLWLAFLDQITRGDAGLVRFLQQFAGYSLTGDTREHALIFGHGPGGNGKGTFLDAVSGTMGTYAKTATMGTLIAKKHEAHLTELAMLRGARLVSASETDEGSAWAEAKLKRLTGGDVITANFMRQDHFEFTPQFKLFVIGNNKPKLGKVDEAMKRRLNMVPFIHRPLIVDKSLGEKLKAEWPSVLRWMIDGCLDWQRNGLVRPQVVIEATAEYFAEQDLFSQWFGENCEAAPLHETSLADLFRSWTEYARGANVPAGQRTELSDRLAGAGFASRKAETGKVFKRIRLKPGEFDDMDTTSVNRSEIPLRH